MQETSHLPDYTLSPIYPTKIRLISLTDICIHYLIHHPVIPVSSLPSELQEHIEKRKDDPFYRVLPMYSVEKCRIFRTTIVEYIGRIDNMSKKGDKINLVLEMLKVVDNDLDSLRYAWKFGAKMQEKLINLPCDGFPVTISRCYLLKWFDYKLILSPPLFPPRPLQSFPSKSKHE